MIDFHTHVLYGVDDGSRDIEMSLDMLDISRVEGVKHVCLTPHYISGEFEIERDEYESRFNKLADRINSLDLKLNHGLEIYINPNLPNLYREKKIWGVNDSKYLLIELPMQQFPIYTEKVFYQLRLEGAVPIIAHPERNLSIIKNKNLLESLINTGTLVQMNSGSLDGIYGAMVKKFAEELVSMNMVHLLGSDAHNTTRRPPEIKDGYRKVRDLNPDIYEWIKENEQKIIYNEEVIELPDIKKINKKRFDIFSLFRK
jgi:protein-tyrosine phosphatase